MMRSVSWVMNYSRRPLDTPDRVGGLPDHLPYMWPRCQACQKQMAFVGQLYESDRFPIGEHLALQFYVCDDCRETRPLVHMEALPVTASPNVRRAGVRCVAQPKLFITLTAVEDSMDQVDV